MSKFSASYSVFLTFYTNQSIWSNIPHQALLALKKTTKKYNYKASKQPLIHFIKQQRKK